MKTVKPQTLSILTRPFELADRYMLALTGIVCVDFAAPRNLAHEALLWMTVQDFLGEAPLDEAMPKARGEVLVLGSACAKAGTTTTAAAARIQLKRADKILFTKSLMAFGDRKWERLGMTQPEPFEKMPVVWERAFGGPEYEPNALGRGLVPVEEEGVKIHRLPNIEDAAASVSSPGDRPTPIGFGPLQITRKERMSRAGTYDKAWLDKLYPAPPADFHWEFYNLAPLDQRIPGFFEGNETLRIEGMHPEHRTLEVSLPDAVVKFFVLRKSKEAAFELEAHTARLDTIVALPTSGKLALVYRAVVQVDSDDAHDIATVMGAVEATDAPKPLSHYTAALKTRMDPERAMFALLNDQELVPDWQVDVKNAIEATFGETAKILKPEGHAFAFVERGIEQKLASMRAELVERGMDTTEFEQQVATIREQHALSKGPDRFEDLGAHLEAVDARAKQASKEAQEKMAELRARAKEELSKVGVHEDPSEGARARKTGPPDCFAEAHYARLRDLRDMAARAGLDTAEFDKQIDDKELEKRLREGEGRLLSIYRQSAHIMPPITGEVTPEEARARGLKLLELAKDNRPLNVDLTKADLSDLDFSGLNLDGAMIEDAKVTGAKFKNASMKEVVLAGAVIDGADFEGANLGGANLAKAKIKGTNLAGVNLDAAVLVETQIEGGSLRGAVIGGIHTQKVQISGTDLSGLRAVRGVFLEVAFVDTSFERADLTDAIFSESSVDGCSFAGAKMTKTVVFQTCGEKVTFAGADLRETRFVECSFPASVFTGAQLGQTLLRGCKLPGAEMEDLAFVNCDFSEADLSGAKLSRTSARQCLFIRTNLDGAVAKKMDLMNSTLQKATIRGTDFRGANCFRADFARAVGDDKTDFSGAYVKETRTTRDPKSKKPLFTA